MSLELRAKLKSARKKLRLTQTQASREWGISLGTLICWENDQRTPSGVHLKLLDAMLDGILAQNGPAESTEPTAPVRESSAKQTVHPDPCQILGHHADSGRSLPHQKRETPSDSSHA